MRFGRSLDAETLKIPMRIPTIPNRGQRGRPRRSTTMFSVGDTLYLILSSHDSATAHAVKVEQADPLVVLAPAEDLDKVLKVGDRISLVHKNGTESQYTEGTISEIGRYGLSLVLHVENVSWNRVDRRRAPRFRVNLAATLTLVTEGASEPIFEAFACETVDVSMVGCLVQLEAPVVPGTLMAVTLHPDDQEEFRFTGIVTRSEGDSRFGIEFFDYCGTTRFRFAQYLNDIAGQAA